MSPNAKDPQAAAKDAGAAGTKNARTSADAAHAQQPSTSEQEQTTQQEDDEAVPPPNAEVVELSFKLTQSEARLSATLTQYKEALEEFNESKARLRRDVGKEIEGKKRGVLTELLEVVDNLERAIDAAQGAGEANNAFFKGVCMVRDQFMQKLEAMGVTKRPAKNQPFDPDHFEAISTVPVKQKEQDGLVIGVVRDCYMMGQETLRHGMVAVGKF